MSNDLIPYKPNPPICTLRDNGITVTIWENRKQGNIYHNAIMERVYQDKNTGEKKTAKSFGLRDIKTLQKLLTRAASEMEKRAVQHLK